MPGMLVVLRCWAQPVAGVAAENAALTQAGQCRASFCTGAYTEVGALDPGRARQARTPSCRRRHLASRPDRVVRRDHRRQAIGPSYEPRLYFAGAAMTHLQPKGCAIGRLH